MERMLTLVRHGQSEGNARNIFTGWLDLPLTDQGVREAEAAGQSLRAGGLGFGSVYTSALGRAKETSRIILDELGLPDLTPVVTTALNERDYGELAGLNKDEAITRWGKEQVHSWRRSYEVAPPGGESLRETTARVLLFFLHDILPAVLSGSGVLVVAHGNSLRALVMALDSLDAPAVEQLEIATGEILVYRFDADARVLAKEQRRA
ncbi:MAG: 2,3-bisphosphoglycerate-dependent phosphoglycerate mutase [Devosia sp.]